MNDREHDQNGDRGDVPAKHSTAETEEQNTGADRDEFVEETTEDSFPASDPPAW
jgi:hypothetical protein